MRVLICGSRDWTRRAVIETYLNGFKVEFGSDLVIIEGDAKGADKIAGDWARKNLLEKNHLCFPADWKKHGKGAGPIRNKQMLVEGKPDIVIAFKDHFDLFLQRGGTENMVEQANNAGIPCYIMQEFTFKKSENWREDSNWCMKGCPH